MPFIKMRPTKLFDPGMNSTRWRLSLAAVWMVVALVVLWQYDLIHRKLDADASFMLYAGQQILRGHAPYVGVAIVKLPFSPLVATLGIGVGRLFTPDDIVSGRVAFWLCAGLAVGALYLIGAQLVQALSSDHRIEFDGTTKQAEKSSQDVIPILVGSFAAVVMLSFQALGVQVANGPEAKLPMVAAGLICVVLIARQKFFWAGMASALAFMAWQPGLVFCAATVICSLVVTERKRNLLQALAGIVLPLALVGIYLGLNGALGSMFRQAFGANANYLDEKKVAVGIFGVLLSNVSKVWQVSLVCSPTETPFIYAGYVGMMVGAVALIYFWWRTRSTLLFLSAFPVLLSGAALFGFSFLDLQKCSDFIPLLPYLALGGAVLFFAVLGLAFRLDARVGVGLGVLLLLATLVYGSGDAFRQRRQKGLDVQRKLAMEIQARLGPGDAAQQFGDTVFLVVTRRENATRFVHLGEKQGLGILTAEGVTMDALIQQLQVANPRVITLSRAKKKDWAKPVYDWIASHYRLGNSYGASEGGTLKDTDVWWKQ